MGDMIPAFEIMVLTPAIRNLIREGKVHQIDGIIYTSAAENMIAMDTSIYNLYKKVSYQSIQLFLRPQTLK